VGPYWLLDGTVRNATKASHAFQIVVAFAAPPRHTLVDTRVINTGTIQPGSSTNFGASGAQDKKGVRCVVKQVQILNS
jgi:hypothetical protein